MISVLLAVRESPQVASWYQALCATRLWQVHNPLHSFDDARQCLALYKPDILITDLRLVDGTVGDALRRLHFSDGRHNTRPCEHVLVLSASETNPLLMDALQAGADNFFLTSGTTPQDLVAHVHATLAGGTDIAPWIARRLLDHFGPPVQAARGQPVEDIINPLGLTPCERTLLQRLAVGERLADVAAGLAVPARQLTDQARAIYRKVQWAKRASDLQLSLT
jgi:DNA-binding NarL/FixJ family response regulator